MKTFEKKRIRPISILLVSMIVLFLMFSGVAVFITLEDGGMMGEGWRRSISWMWIPAFFFLSISLMIGRFIYTKKIAAT